MLTNFSHTDCEDRIPCGRERVRRSRGSTRLLLPRPRLEGIGILVDIASLQGMRSATSRIF